jgi:hypothetical protein
LNPATYRGMTDEELLKPLGMTMSGGTVASSSAIQPCTPAI